MYIYIVIFFIHLCFLYMHIRVWHFPAFSARSLGRLNFGSFIFVCITMLPAREELLPASTVPTCGGKVSVTQAWWRIDFSKSFFAYIGYMCVGVCESVGAWVHACMYI